MKTMSFSGRSMREAMALAKQRFGADVDILSSDVVGDEIRVTVVVPEPRSAGRRRKAAEQVSAGLKALADSPMKGERRRAGSQGVETADMEAQAAATEAPGGREVVEAAEGAAAKAAAPETAPESGKSTRRTKAGRASAARTRTADKGTKARDEAQDRAVADFPALNDDAGEADGTTEGRSAGAQEVSADAQKPAGGLEAGADAAAQPPLSTLDFEAQRRKRLAEKGMPVADAGTVALPAQAAALAQALASAQGPATAGSAAPARTGLPGVSTASAGGAAAVPGAGLRQAAATVGAAGAVGIATAGTPAAVSAEAAGAMAPAQPVGSVQAAQAEGGRSKLSLVMDSARRMLGSGPGRWLGRAPEQVTPPAAVAGAQSAAAAASADPQVLGDRQAPMPLSSLLQSEPSSEWPSLSLGEDEHEEADGADAAQSGMAEAQADGRVQKAQAESRLDGIGWFELARRRPGQMRLLRNLLSCQFSPSLARTLVSLLPVDYSDVQADEWLRQTMMRALAGVNSAAGVMPGNNEHTIFDRGGVFALIGPTGVGKTTSIAKIAAHHVLRHGPKSLALITADVYRIGAQEQLRAFGKMLGVPVQVAQDRDVLQTLLKEHEGRSLVLIDTAGISQRDERVSQLTSALELAQVKRILVLNAGSQPGGIEDVLRAFGARDTAGVLLSKVDEAVGLGACLDALIRHRLPLVGYTDGQRVPEDYHAANLGQLIESALDGQVTNRYPSLSMTDSEIRHLFEGAHV